jgi:hypothetical protein
LQQPKKHVARAVRKNASEAADTRIWRVARVCFPTPAIVGREAGFERRSRKFVA